MIGNGHTKEAVECGSEALNYDDQENGSLGPDSKLCHSVKF